MPVPPKESMGGKRKDQHLAFNAHTSMYELLMELDVFVETEIFTSMDEEEKNKILDVKERVESAYEPLRELIEDY